MGAWLRDLKLKPSLSPAVSWLSRASLWQRHEADQLVVLALNSLVVEISLGGIHTEGAPVWIKACVRML